LFEAALLDIAPGSGSGSGEEKKRKQVSAIEKFYSVEKRPQQTKELGAAQRKIA
jgi:hypothetical protein